jgi:hypothetical protein
VPGWVPYNSFNVNEEVPGSIAAPAKAMAYAWTHFIGGHMGRLVPATTWPCTSST